MKRFLTEYSVGRSKYGADIYARSEKEAWWMCVQRGIGEKVRGEVKFRGGLKRPRTELEKLHEAIFLGWMALETGRMTPEQLLGDKGLIHEMVHNMNPLVKKKQVHKVVGLTKRLRTLQKRTPGHRP